MKLPFSVLDIESETWYEGTDREIYGKAICDVGGRSKVGVGYMELPPNSSTKPAHWHSSEEEHLYVLSGTANLHLGDELFLLETDSYVCFPAGQSEAHYLHNTGVEMFVYIMIGERIEGDQVTYSS